MRPIIVIVVVVLLILAAAPPASAAKEHAADDDGNAGHAGDQTGHGETTQERALAAGNATVTAGQTLRLEDRRENLDGAGNRMPALNQTRDRDEGKKEDEQGSGAEPATPRSKNISLVRHDREELNATLRNATPVRAGWTATGNDVRLAVHTLLAMENLTGGIGPQVSAVAREFNNSASQSWQLEERIRNRDALSRFFFGGDQVSAAELATMTAQDQNRIRQIEQLVNNETLDAETRAMAEEQIRILQQENARLGRVASAEEQSHGLLGWFGK